MQKLFPFKHVIPTHQGRAAEKILFGVVGGPDKVVPNNAHFDTTRANVEYTGAEAVDLYRGGTQPTVDPSLQGQHGRRRAGGLIDERGVENIPVVIMTVTNNSVGGQPCRWPTCAPCARSATDTACRSSSTRAASPRTRGSSSSARTATRTDRIPDIVREMAALADGMTMSAKKDGLANIGGWLAMNDDSLAERCRNMLILTEGFPTYGGLAGRDLEAIAQGLDEVVEEDYLRYRIRRPPISAKRWSPSGVPVVLPIGGHAVYIDAGALLPHIPPLAYPGQSLAIALYREGGIRGCEIGTVMFGQHRTGPKCRRRWSWCASPSRGGPIPSRTSTT